MEEWTTSSRWGHWVDDLNTKVRDIEYIGKGTIASIATDFAKEQTIPAIRVKDETKDFMNLWFMGGPQGLLECQRRLFTAQFVL